MRAFCAWKLPPTVALKTDSHPALPPSPVSGTGELQGRQPGIQRALLDQLAMSAHRHQAPLVDDRDALGVLDRGQPMGDDQRGTPGHQAGQCLLDQVFALRVEGAGGFVQQQDRRVHQ